MAKIKKLNFEEILFEDGSTISYHHAPDCCEYNYADFEQLDDIARATDFDTANMIFEKSEEYGFRFGNTEKMFFIPCYSEQNSYYSSDVDILWNGEFVFNVDCEV